MKRLRQICIILLCAALLSVSVFAAGATVDEMKVNLTVDQNGTARAETSLHVVSEEPMNSFSIGLGPNVSGVHVDGFSGAHVSHIGNQTSVDFEDSNALPSSMDLHISYTIRNTVQSGNDLQHFSVRLLGGLKDADIQKFNAIVEMPAAFEAIPEFYSGYYAEGIDNYLTISVNDGVLTVDSSDSESMLAGETLDLNLDTPLEYFTLHNVAGQTLTVDRILLAVLGLFGLLYWWKSLRSTLPTLTTQTQAPMGVEPGTVATILTGEKPDLALMTMNWATNGYLRITRLRGKKLVLLRLMPMGNERSNYEQAVFSQLFAQSPEVLCGSKVWRSAQKKADKIARRYWEVRLFEKNPGKPSVLRIVAVLFCAVSFLDFADKILPSMYLRVLLLATFVIVGLIWGIILQISLKQLPMRRRKKSIICIAICVVLLIVAWRITKRAGVLLLALIVSIAVEVLLLFGPRRKRSGVNLLSELLSWRRFLKNLSQDDASQLLQADPQYYYRTLLFAEGLGVGRKFNKAFTGLRLDECAFLDREGKELPRTADKYRPSFLSTLALARGENNDNVKKKPAASKKSAPASARKRFRPEDVEVLSDD